MATPRNYDRPKARGADAGVAPQRVRKKRKLAHAVERETPQKGRDCLLNQNTEATTPSQARDRTGRRMSEVIEPEPVLSSRSHSGPNSSTLRIDESASVNEDSDDDAPEEAATSATQDVIAVKARKAAETESKAQAKKALKKKEHDARMRAQAEAVKQGKRQESARHLAAEPSSGESLGEDNESAALPELLPEHILNERPGNGMTVHQPHDETTSKRARQLKLLTQQDGPPKDIVRGETRIRLLPDQTGILPPRSASKNKQLRERWLLGERGGDSSFWVRRQKPTKGFARARP